MTTTRRKSKAAAEQDTEPSRPLTVTLPADIDEDTLSSLLPETNLTSISSEDVIALFRLVVTQVISLDNSERERDDARAELERKDIELDQVLQDKEGLSKDLEVSVEAAIEELNLVKQERDQLVEAKTALQSQFTTLSTSQSSVSSEVESLRRNADEIGREKRDLVNVISRLKDEATQRDDEIHTLRTSLKEARQEQQASETHIRELRSLETATKFRIDSLEQQLQLSQTESERANNELMAKTEEFAKYRRTKHAETATLQASFDTLSQSNASSEASLKALQSAHTAQGHQLTQALSKVQDLNVQLAEQESRYSNEVNNLKRLVSMMEEREKQAKEIVESVEHEWATVGEKAERREALLRDEAEKERKTRLESEKRLEQLEAVLEKMGRGELPIPGRSTPSTPFRGNGSSDTIDVMMGLSPTVAIASRVQRSGKTFTEVYADYVRLQEDYVKKCAEYDHMDRTLSSVLAQIEERAPILSQQRMEYERLQAEAAQLGSQLSQALSERDSQASLAQETVQKLSKSTNENSLLQKQLDDLGRQVQHLLREIARRDDPTIPSNEELEVIPIEAVSDTADLISNHLVLFRNIDGLQQQNQRLLKIVRDLGEKMESEEREYRETMEREQAEAVREAHEAMQELAIQLERQKQSSDSIVKAYVKDRDALKAMLARTETGARSDASGVANGVTAATPGDLENELAEVQSRFDTYKLEMGIDSGRLRDELLATQREINSMSASLAKANAKVEFLTDRQRVHEEQFRVHHFEIDELSKRNAHLNEQNLRFDIECGRLTDELQVSIGRLEQLRNECANLRAEKKIWESVQNRLAEENRSLAMERSYLADLMNNVQKMHNDLERSGENDRRRLEGQLQMFENQNQDLRTQLLQERESIRHITLQKDIELKELQARIEKNVQEFSKTRESLVEAQTSRKHLEERVEDLTRQLKGNEEKLAVYERRPGSITTSQPDISRDQQLETEVAELRSALKIAEVDLATAKSHRDQFQEISQASEGALSALNATFEEYKMSSEASLARYESEVKSLQERVEQSGNELAEVRARSNESQKRFEAERTSWINDKKTLEDTIVDLSSSEKQTESDRNSREQEMRVLDERVKNAEQRYSQEIIAHAESMKAFEILKKDLAASQASVREQRTAAETAHAKLASSEHSWKQQRDALDKEIADLNIRCQELSTQNAMLHQHLESVSAQATRIRQAAETPMEVTTTEAAANDDTDNRLSELRSVVSYLRKEKSIVDLQLEMAKRENGVLKNQIERMSSTLQETRATLAEERERAIQNTASAAQHAEHLERINQLNILRESNATLRTEHESSTKKARELESKLNRLSSELNPAKEQARSAVAELEAAKVQMQRLEQESRRWQERNVQLLSKYDRIDPSEVQALKDEISQLKQEVATAQGKLTEKEAAVDTSLKRVEALEASLRAHKETIQKNVHGFRQRMGEVNKQVSALTEEKSKLETKISSLEQEISVLKTTQPSLPDGAVANTAQTEEIHKQNEIIASLRSEREQLLAEKSTWSKQTASASEPANSAAPENWEAEKAELVKSRDEALEKLKMAESDSQKTSNDMKNIKFQNDKFQSRIQDLMKTKAADSGKQALAIAEAFAKGKAEVDSTSDSASLEELSKRHAEELKALEAKLKSEHGAAVQEALQFRPAPSPNADQQAIIDAAIAEVEKKAQSRLQEEIASALERGRMEQAAKNKLKDSQLVKAQKRVKELEAQIHERQAVGITSPSTSTSNTPSTPVAAVNSPTQPSAKTLAQTGHPTAKSATTVTQVPPGPSQPKPIPVTAAANAAAASNAPLPRKPPAGPAATRGGALLRGAGRGGPPGRGAAPLRQPPVKPTASTPTSGGVSIMGAATKRPRDDGSTSSEDSLAKRLKPAEG